MLSQEVQGKPDLYVPKAMFYNRDVMKVVQEFILFPSVVQVGLFGVLAQHSIGDQVKLALIVDDEILFKKFVDLVTTYQDRTDYKRDARQVRLAAFDVLWGRHRVQWHRCLTSERNVNLRLYVDIVVLPFDWQARIDEIEPMLMQASPVSLTEICRTVCFYKTEV